MDDTSQPKNAPHTPVPLGRVIFVGAGPGHLGLATVWALEALEEADFVLYDYLANPLLLSVCRPGVSSVCLGRHGHGKLLSCQEICQQMVAAAQAGQVVVRLKGGDPLLFAHASEEMGALEAAGIPYEIIPGVTAAQAAAAKTGIPLTDREGASAVALVAGHLKEIPADAAQNLGSPQNPGSPQNLDYQALAQFPGTLVFYMGVTTSKVWSSALVAAGKSPQTPVAVIRRASWPDESCFVTTLEEVSQQLEEQAVRPPAIIFVGDVARQAARTRLQTRPLSSRCVLTARPRVTGEAPSAVDRAEVQSLTRLGADVVWQPAIEIHPPTTWNEVDDAIARLPQFDWVVFSSANGVSQFLSRLMQLADVRRLANCRLAAVGPATLQRLREFHLAADLVPGVHAGEALAQALLAASPPAAKYLLVRANRGREILPDMLTAAGAQVETVVAYESRDVAEAAPEILQRMREGQIHWTLVTSSAIAKNLVRLFGESLRKTKLASISPISSETLQSLGFSPAAEASIYTQAGLVQAILQAERPPGTVDP